jgi:hypothetical protein
MEKFGTFATVDDAAAAAWARLNSDRTERIYLCYERGGFLRTRRIAAVLRLTMASGTPHLEVENRRNGGKRMSHKPSNPA